MKHILALTLVAILGLGGAVLANDDDNYEKIPAKQSQITDSKVKKDIREYNSEYDDMPRIDQVRVYVETYIAVYDGKQPSLSPEDKELYEEATRPTM